MKLFLFSASVFYLLGLKLTSQIEVKSHLFNKPATIETKVYPELENNAQPIPLKPESVKKAQATSPETKSGQLAAPCNKTSEK